MKDSAPTSGPAVSTADFVAAAGLPNRFLVLAQLIRQAAHSSRNETIFETIVARQIQNLRQRLALIRPDMQKAQGFPALLLWHPLNVCPFIQQQQLAESLFGISLLLLVGSLLTSLY